MVRGGWGCTTNRPVAIFDRTHMVIYNTYSGKFAAVHRSRHWVISCCHAVIGLAAIFLIRLLAIRRTEKISTWAHPSFEKRRSPWHDVYTSTIALLYSPYYLLSNTVVTLFSTSTHFASWFCRCGPAPRLALLVGSLFCRLVLYASKPLKHSRIVYQWHTKAGF